jgi:hypothetical protein
VPDLVVVLYLHAAAVSLLYLRAHRQLSVPVRFAAAGSAALCLSAAALVTWRFLYWTTASGVWVAGLMTVAIVVLVIGPVHPRLSNLSGLAAFLAAASGTVTAL